MPNTGRNYRHPPAIHHIGRRDENHTQTVRQAAKVVRLPDRATKLLTFYADCPDGFRPALKTVRENTGIATNCRLHHSQMPCDRWIHPVRRREHLPTVGQD